MRSEIFQEVGVIVDVPDVPILGTAVIEIETKELLSNLKHSHPSRALSITSWVDLLQISKSFLVNLA